MPIPGQATVDLWSPPAGQPEQGYFHIPADTSRGALESACKERTKRWVAFREKRGYRLVSNVTISGPHTPIDPVQREQGNVLWRVVAMFKRVKPKVITLDEYRFWMDKHDELGIAPTKGNQLESDDDLDELAWMGFPDRRTTLGAESGQGRIIK